MKPLQRLGIFISINIFVATLLQSPLTAANVRVLVSPGQKKQLAELERSLPNLELVTAKPDQVLDVIGNCDAIIGLGYGGDRSRQIIQAGKKLRWVHSTSAGVENTVWIPELKDSDIILTNAKIFQGPEIADHAFGLLLTLTRNLKHYNRRMDEGWGRVTPELPIVELRGKTMLIVGLGGIGTQIAQRASAFDMRVLAVDPKDIPLMHIVERVVRPDQLHEVLPEADVVVSSVPHTPASEGMFGKKEFALMRDGVYFVNVSRGKVVQTEALVEALSSGKVLAAGLDVTNPEPLPKDHPLWKMNNVIITPHIATISVRSRTRLLELIRSNIERFVTGKPMLNVVNKAAGY